MEKKKPDYGMKCIHFSIYFNEKTGIAFAKFVTLAL